MKSGASVEELQAKIEDMSKEHTMAITAMEKQALRDRKTAAVKAALSKAGAHNADVAFNALGVDLDKLNFDEQGKLGGLDEAFKRLQASDSYLWKAEEGKNSHLPSNPMGGNSLRETIDQMHKNAGT